MPEEIAKTNDEGPIWRWLLALRHGNAGAATAEDVPAADHPLVALFAPLARLRPGERFVLAHLGQSVDGRIATESGHSHYIGGSESLVHLHRLRALVDAVVIGVGTALADAPRLTVRHVEGPNPVRVVIDPRGRLGPETSLASDRLAPTLVVRARGTAQPLPPHVEIVEIAMDEQGRLAPGDALDALAARGLEHLLIEGGGQTVSGFVAAGVVDRLQLAVAPLLIGSGRPALALEPIATLDAALRPPCRRFDLGDDTLFEFDLANLRRTRGQTDGNTDAGGSIRGT